MDRKAARRRGESEATDASTVLDAATKRELLDSMPDHDDDDDDDADHHDHEEEPRRKRLKRTDSDMSDSDSSDNINNNNHNNNNHKTSPPPPQLKNTHRLSKWTARLFDPNRPRGLVQSPQVIPLNDEFLKAFGQREKAWDAARGVAALDVEQRITASDDDDDDSLYGDLSAAAVKFTASNNHNQNDDDDNDDEDTTTSDKLARRVRIFNLKYTTTEKDLLEACSAYGPVVSLDLPLDSDDESSKNYQNKGRATVVFDTEQAAKACAEGLTELDGRSLGVYQGNAPTRKPPTVARYYVRDISTKCYRCGEVGHREADCQNPARAKPCPLCAGIDHDLRQCPIKPVCFNCGVPGHVARDCTRPRGLPLPTICTVCFQKGHTKMTCRQSYREASAVSQDAVCMMCGERGHYLCKQLQWFFGVEGVSCGNCGQAGHIGQECRRPNLDLLARDDQLARREVERVLEEEEEMGRRRQMEYQQNNRRMPNNNNNNIRGRGSQYQPRNPRNGRKSV